jgi:hypothetical protein
MQIVEQIARDDPAREVPYVGEARILMPAGYGGKIPLR